MPGGAGLGQPVSPGPGGGRAGMTVSAPSAVSSEKKKVPTHPARSCPGLGHPARFRAGCGGGTEPSGPRCCFHPRPPPGGTSRPHRARFRG